MVSVQHGFGYFGLRRFEKGCCFLKMYKGGYQDSHEEGLGFRAQGIKPRPTVFSQPSDAE